MKIPRAEPVGCCLHACVQNSSLFACQLQNSSWHILLSKKLYALLAQETTKSHHYLDCIMGPPTHAVCPRYSDRDVYTSQTPDVVHYSTVWDITNRRTGVWCWSGKKACMITGWVSQQHRWPDLLLAVMVAEGGERAARQSLPLYLQDSNIPDQLFLALERPSDPGSNLIQVSISAWCGQHFGIFFT